MMPPTIDAVWMGRKLGPVHAGCLASFVRVGHRTVLHAFDEIEDVPQGVESFDASRLMAADEIIRHRRTSSLALASDIYRYRILRENLGIYVDRDILCLGPFPDVDYLFGWESERLVNGAVLGMPPDSALLRSVMRDAEDPRFIPPWDGRLRRMTSRMRQMLGTADTRPHLKWGSIGPGLITHHVMRLGLERHAMDIDVFYPLHLHHRCLLNDPELTIGDHATRRSLALHLWSSGGAVGEIRTGSTLDRIATGHVTVRRAGNRRRLDTAMTCRPDGSSQLSIMSRTGPAVSPEPGGAVSCRSPVFRHRLSTTGRLGVALRGVRGYEGNP